MPCVKYSGARHLYGTATKNKSTSIIIKSTSASS
jgi:hypothetical protein